MKHFILSFLFIIPQVYATEVIIFDCRRPIAMSENDKPQKDFYLNAGSEMGLKKGVIVTVHRRVPLYNTVTNSSAGDLQLDVAKLKVIHVQNRLSVARLVNESKKNNDDPILEDPYILIGDRVDLGTATAAEADPVDTTPKETAAFAPQAPSPVSVDLKVEVLPAPTPAPAPVIPDQKSVERQTATLDNPTLQ